MGIFIAIEGLDASGKNTQSNLLLKYFSRIQELNTTKFDLPKYESVTGEMIKDHLMGKWKVNVQDKPKPEPFDFNDSSFPEPYELTGLYASDPSTYLFQCCQLVNRMETLPDGIWNQDPRDVYIADRYNASAYAYGVAFGIDFDWLVKTHIHLPQPDLNIFLDIPVEESFKRRPERRDNYEKNASMLENVRKSYLSVFERLGPTYVTVDATGTVDETFIKIHREIERVAKGDIKRLAFC